MNITDELFNITRKRAEEIVNNHQWCLIHNCPMIEYGEADLCGTFPTRCKRCEKGRDDDGKET